MGRRLALRHREPHGLVLDLAELLFVQGGSADGGVVIESLALLVSVQRLDDRVTHDRAARLVCHEHCLRLSNETVKGNRTRSLGLADLRPSARPVTVDGPGDGPGDLRNVRTRGITLPSHGDGALRSFDGTSG